MSSQSDYSDRFAESGLRVLESAMAEARRRQQNYVSLWHMLNALEIEDAASFQTLISGFGLNALLVKEFIEKAMASAPAHAGRGIRIAPEVNSLLQEARSIAKLHRRERIEAADLLLVMGQSIKLGPPWVNRSMN